MAETPSLPIIERIARHDGYEFPRCDMRHEALKRDHQGKLTNGPRGYVDQCLMACRANRPACAHFAEDDEMHPLPDPIRGDLMLLVAHNVEGAALLSKEYDELRLALNNGNKGGMDKAMRDARCGTMSGGDIPTKEEAKEAAALLTPHHRALVERMETVTGKIRAALQTLLPTEPASSMMGTCDEQPSSLSGSSPTPRSSLLRTPSDTSPASASSSPPIFRSSIT